MNVAGPLLGCVFLAALFVAEIIHQRREEQRARVEALLEAFRPIYAEMTVDFRALTLAFEPFVRAFESLIPALVAVGDALRPIIEAARNDELATVGTLYYFDRRFPL